MLEAKVMEADEQGLQADTVSLPCILRLNHRVWSDKTTLSL